MSKVNLVVAVAAVAAVAAAVAVVAAAVVVAVVAVAAVAAVAAIEGTVEVAVLPAVAIAGFQCHAIQNRSNKKSKPSKRLSLESEKRKKVDMQRLSPRFRSQHFFSWKIFGETFSTNL